jgi:lycopene cyclase domain-containing protein
MEINPKLIIPERLTRQISIALLLLFGLLLLFNIQRAYTAVDMVFGLIILGLVLYKNKALLRSFYITFLFMLIPFFIVNGILTGTGIEGNVVWYNDDENLGIRLGTIPVEDIVYAFSLILLNLFLFDRFKKKDLSKV